MALWRRLKGRLQLALASDEAFIEQAYRDILGRPPDQDGLHHYKRALAEGHTRTAVLVSLVRSDEFTSRLVRQKDEVPPLFPLRPEAYGTDRDLLSGQVVNVFDVGDPSDFDWLEAMIARHGYYERPGVWNFGIDVDKRVMAEVLASFAPRRALELGCANGAILKCLGDLGVGAEGVEISRMAVEQAPREVKERIHLGDVLDLPLGGPYDLVFGLDIFEHLNPNRLRAYLGRLAGLCAPGGWLFANVPAFGEDAVFGTVFPPYLRTWEGDLAAGRAFTRLHVDDSGYPLHGHLVTAGTAWWVRQFEAVGLRREVEVEEALHAKYDPYMDRRSPARKAFYVFSRDAEVAARRAVVSRVRAEPSHVLREMA